MRLLLPVLLGIMALACSTVVEVETSNTASSNTDTLPQPDPNPLPPKALLDAYLDPLLADGFDFPVGTADAKGSYTNGVGTYAGWYVATHFNESYSMGLHTGEDWNGNGGGDTDAGQPVYATAWGVVVDAQHYAAPWGNVVLVEHHFLNNNQIDTVFSQYAHLDTYTVHVGDTIKRRQKVGTIGDGDGSFKAHLHFELRRASMRDFSTVYWPSSEGKDSAFIAAQYLEPSSFIKAHRTIVVPALEKDFLLADKSAYTMWHCSLGKLVNTYEIALSQNPNGHKVKQGDLRLPEGLYRIIQKTKGPISGNMGPWFGAAWMRLSYPNPWDIDAGVSKGWISSSKAKEMKKAWHAGKEPDKRTQLGGGIGIHGWNGDWTANGFQNLTWGCISMHNSDLASLFEKLSMQTLVITVP